MHHQVRRPVPPPPPRRKEANETSVADRLANLSLNENPTIRRKVPPPPPRRSSTQQSLDERTPPPIPYHTRPSPDEIRQAFARHPPPPPGTPARLPTPEPESEPEPELELPPADDDACLECYDFSVVDQHAAQFPRHTVRSLDELAYSLTSPFASETEKARAIFTWLHHNIAYDAGAFFSGNIRSQSPADTLHSGLAVCDGYAGLFARLAELAGLQAQKVTGHGKGFGYSPLAPGEHAPPYNGNHAWNCVLLDGEWRLIDSCWGAGYLEGTSYTQKFTPRFFTSSPVEFGKRHYPEDPSYQLLSDDDDGPVSWEDYILDPEGPQLFIDFYIFDFSPMFLQPASKYLPQGLPASFHLFKRCQHMSTEEADNYPYFLLHGDAQIPLQRNAEGGWSASIPSVRAEVSLMRLQTYNGQDAKGVTVRQFLSARGGRSWSWSGLAVWTLAE
ncbi:hypothetical protein M378DRAFT_161094 [Amanita muscaria Koide BX008]|uniref:Transglutaminase-like domain-containing protein n=1 Tax=Amanita muscaria (strain Koide BX008) TaxID=946122 RepID=A0A0C2TH35_AMAMK|nr:hypothetical protein M378DRAFT_161094 [Amanita muscaria Koide BX008]